jgi:cytochrome c peroxidase
MNRLLVALLGLAALSAHAGAKKAAAPKPGAKKAAASKPAPDVVVDPALLEFFKPLPARFESDANPTSEAKVTLGRMLYFDTRLSKNHDLSCDSCHGLHTFGVDNQKFSTGHKGQKGGRNSPTVYNAGDHIAQFWDGRASSLEEQAKGPVTNPVEMAMPDEKRVVATLKSIPRYVELFQQAFPGQAEPVTFDNVGNAIGAFERGLVTPGRFDKFVAGDKTALTAEEKQGLVKFAELGCTTCHNGPAVGGASFQRLGLVTPYPDESDLGRFSVTQDEGDRMVFRVPTLRNIAKTAPYFHDGSFTELEPVVKTMAKHQLGREISDEDARQVTAFLRSLTGELPTAYIQKPELPPSTPATPKPDPS